MSHPQGKWNIDSAGVDGVLATTREVAGGLEGEAKSYAKNLEHAAGHAGKLSTEDGAIGAVGAALGQFALATEAALKFVFTRAGKSIDGAQNASNKYAIGDEQMAAEAQSKALEGTRIPPFHLAPQDKK
ncbi:DUF6507 family protein [Streptantibioticus ferralitis]|uniref:DUF6507 family protein n=1 Tax=Streptantibioticus ferralitis TaxID=236510 RepID=A0ABT5Z3N3_9ACTN|nr:DUF6507 family protein [Streptantibioticus ferralitis]MDF2257655.1 DUF6507 family protein [Streptantibioticus ferralitis]